MARYNSINTTGSVAQGSSIASPYSGLLTTITTGSGSVALPNPVLYAGSTQTFYNSTSTAVTLTTPSGVFNGPAAGGTSSLTLPIGAVITLVSDGTNYIAQDWLGGPASHTTITASGTITATSAVSFNPSNANISIQPTGTGTVTINPATAGTLDNVAIGSTTASTGKFTSVISSGNVAIGQSSTTSYALTVFGTSGRFFDALGNTTQIRLAASEGGWASGYNWAANNGTVLGGLQGNGSGQAMSSLGVYVGGMSTPTLTLNSTQLLVGTTSTSDAARKILASGSDVNAQKIDVTNTQSGSLIEIIAAGSTAYSIGGWDYSGVIEATGGGSGTSGLVLSSYNGPLILQTNARTERMRITSSGYVGVNTTNTNTATGNYTFNVALRARFNGMMLGNNDGTNASDNRISLDWSSGTNAQILAQQNVPLQLGSNNAVQLTLQPGLSSFSTPMVVNSGTQFCFYTYANTSSGSYYIHMKTNLPKTISQMYSVEAKGYVYGQSQSVGGYWVGYMYQPNGNSNPIAVGNSNYAQAALCNNQYLSSDGYLVLVAYVSGGYFTGFTLNNHYTTQGLYGMQITASTTSGSSTGAY